jgi:G:T-mismatch repair DNA endonuclease (very short patch repair protein)
MNFLEPLNISYDRQFYLKDIHQYCDFYIPSKNTVIEINGDFWHCNPNIERFKEPKYEYQIRKIERDKIKYDYLDNNGFKKIILWEHDIKNNKKLINEELKKIANENTERKI